VDGNGTLSSGRVPFSDAISDASYSNLILTQGQANANYTVGCFVQVLDWYGAAGEDTQVVHVQPQALTLAALLNQSTAASAAALASGNAETTRQVLKATAAALQTAAADGGARRALLATSSGGGDNTEARTALLAELWEAYAITEITAADVASLLATLEGIVDTPLEVSDSTAASALGLLRELLRALRANDAELTATASGYVGTTLESLFHTAIFNVSFGIGSLAYADNVTDILR
jgi:hypothetical protein